MTTARQEVLIQGEVGVYHCISRCVRRAWLCGDDPLSGVNLDNIVETHIFNLIICPSVYCRVVWR